MSPGEAYGYFGFLLGLLAPAAIFARTVNYGIGAPMSRVFVFCLLMNLTCAFVGKWTGKSFAKSFARANRKSWTKMLFQTTLLGFCWAMITGAAGGAIFFGVGAIFGAIMAIPVGVAAFPLFATIYRLLERGEEVEFKHFLPIALGVSTVISAYILGC